MSLSTVECKKSNAINKIKEAQSISSKEKGISTNEKDKNETFKPSDYTLKTKKEYVYEQINYFFIFMITILILNVIISFIKIENIYLNLVTNVLVSMVVSITIFVILYHKTDSFRYYCNFVKSILKKIKKK